MDWLRRAVCSLEQGSTSSQYSLVRLFDQHPSWGYNNCIDGDTDAYPSLALHRLLHGLRAVPGVLAPAGRHPLYLHCPLRMEPFELDKLEPLLVRANVTTKLRLLREEITKLRTKPNLDHEEQLLIQKLIATHDILKTRFIFLISENHDNQSSTSAESLGTQKP
jgi:hypothetical protein